MRKNSLLAVIYKQMHDCLRNKLIILMIFMYPILTYIFYFLLHDTPEAINMVIPIFITMHIIMTPIICMSSIISEEKEKNTLKVLFFSNVKGREYLLGVGMVILFILILSLIPYLLILDFTIMELSIFYLFSIFGLITSLLLGAVIGIVAKNQMSVGTISSPLSMIIGLLPMMAVFNTTINKFSKIIYSKQIYDIVYKFLVSEEVDYQTLILICISNMIVFIFMFSIVYRRTGVENPNR